MMYQVQVARPDGRSGIAVQVEASSSEEAKTVAMPKLVADGYQPMGKHESWVFTITQLGVEG